MTDPKPLTAEQKLRSFIHDHAYDNEPNVLWWLGEALDAARGERDALREHLERITAECLRVCIHVDHCPIAALEADKSGEDRA